MAKLAVSTQADVMEQAYPVIEAKTDYHFARMSAPANLAQIEGMLAIDPDNQTLLLLATKGFTSYAYGFVEDEMEEAEANGDLEHADEARERARQMYLKAKRFGVHLLELMAPGLSDSMQRDPDKLKQFLESEVTDNSAAAALFWTGSAWGSAINISRDDPTLIADLPMPNTLVGRAVQLDEGYFNAGGHMFLGLVNSSRGAAVGGDPQRGKQHFERALALTQRKSLVIQFNYAQTYAIQTQDKALFVSLLNEVLAAETAEDSPVALANAIAKRRAKRLLSQVDNLFFEEGPALEAPPPTPELQPAPEVTPAAGATALPDAAAAGPAVAPPPAPPSAETAPTTKSQAPGGQTTP